MADVEPKTIRTLQGDDFTAHPARIAKLLELGVIEELRPGIYVIKDGIDAKLRQAVNAAIDISGVFA